MEPSASVNYNRLGMVATEINNATGREVNALVKRVWKTAKRPFLRFASNRVVPLSPQNTDPVLDGPPLRTCIGLDLLSRPGPSRIQPTVDVQNANSSCLESPLESLPGHVCVSLESLSLPGQPGIQQTIDVRNADPSCSVSPATDADHPELESPQGPVWVSLESLSLPGPPSVQQTVDVLNSDPSHSESPVTDADHPELESPPGLVCVSLESLSLPDPSRTQQTVDVLNANPFHPESSTTDADHPQLESLGSLCAPGPSHIQQMVDAPNADPSYLDWTTTYITHPDTEVECPPGHFSLPGPSGIQQKVHPDLSGLAPKLPKVPGSTWRKEGKVHDFFKRVWKAAKRPFSDPERVQPHSPHQELADSQSVPNQNAPNFTGRADSEPGRISAQPSTSEFDECHYKVGELIGKGSFGRVYEASFMTNNGQMKVALKQITKYCNDRYFYIDGHASPVYAELAVLLQLGKPPACPYIIKLHHWTEDHKFIILFMELPENCCSLNCYIRSSADMNEDKARFLMRQVLQGIKHCVKRGIFVGDLHTSNILLSRPSLGLKFMDFGCAIPITTEPFNSSEYRGDLLYTPPEIFNYFRFHAAPAYVWTLGVLLFEILHKRLPFRNLCSLHYGWIKMNQTLSAECRDLISGCLTRNPANRLKLNALEEHRWFNPLSPTSVDH